MNKYIFLALIFVAAFADDYTRDEGVVVLTDDNFDKAISEFDFALVEFYAPWCGHCKKLTPEYAAAAQKLAESNPEIKLCKVDATEQKGLANRFEIRGFPTLKFFIKGSSGPIEYEGGRTTAEIINWLKKKTGPVSTEVTSADKIDSAVSSSELVGVFFGNTGSKAYADYTVVAGSNDDIVFFHSNDDGVKSHFGVQDDTFVLFKNFDEKKNTFTGPWSVDAIKNFVNTHKFPTVLPFDQKAAQRIFGEGISALFLLTSSNEASKKAEAAFSAVANDLKSKITLSLARLGEGMGSRLADYIGVTESQTPTLRIVLPNEEMKKFQFEGEVTEESIKNFVDDWSNGRLKPFYKSEPIPESNDEPVKVLVGKNFQEIVIDSDADVLVEFYAPWCGHCKSLAPIYDSLAKRLSNVSGLTIAKMDATANEVEGVSVRGFPTIKFYPKGRKQNPLEFDGDRTEEGFVDFLKKHGTAKIESAGSHDHAHDHAHDHGHGGEL